MTKMEKQMSRNDAINPSHYKDHPSGIECIEITEHLDFCLGNAWKYLWRAGTKEGVPVEQDLEKALWYLKREHYYKGVRRYEKNLTFLHDKYAKIFEYETRTLVRECFKSIIAYRNGCYEYALVPPTILLHGAINPIKLALKEGVTFGKL